MIRFLLYYDYRLLTFTVLCCLPLFRIKMNLSAVVGRFDTYHICYFYCQYPRLIPFSTSLCNTCHLPPQRRLSYCLPTTITSTSTRHSSSYLSNSRHTTLPHFSLSARRHTLSHISPPSALRNSDACLLPRHLYWPLNPTLFRTQLSKLYPAAHDHTVAMVNPPVLSFGHVTVKVPQFMNSS